MVETEFGVINWYCTLTTYKTQQECVITFSTVLTMANAKISANVEH